jgi:excisionase family DNA binding protein
MKKNISTKEAASEKNCSVGTILRWIHNEKIDAEKINGKWKIECNKKWKLAEKKQKSVSDQEEVEMLKKRCSELQKRCNELEKENKGLCWTINSLNNSCANFCKRDTQKEILIQSLSKTIGGMAEFSKICSELQKRCNELEKENKGLCWTINSLNNSCADFCERDTQKESLIQSLSKTIGEMAEFFKHCGVKIEITKFVSFVFV